MPHLYDTKVWSVGDVIAGVTVAATSLPQYIAYAELAGLTGYVGLMTAGPPIVAFALVTSSPTVCVGVTSITALMAHATLNGSEYKETHGEEQWMDLLGTFSVLVGICSVALAVLGAGKLTKHIPKSVKSGWKLGFAVLAMASQMPGAVFAQGAMQLKKLCVLPSFLPPGGAVSMYRLGWLLGHPYMWDGATVVLTAFALAVVLKGGKFLSKAIPLHGIEVLAATLFGTLLSMAFGYTGRKVGLPPEGAPPLDSLLHHLVDPSTAGQGLAARLLGWVRLWPWEMPWAELFEVLGGPFWTIVSATAFAAVDFLGILSVVPEGPPVELVGQGVGCVVSGMLGNAPIGGSLSRSLVVGMIGASSPLMSLSSGLFTLFLGFPLIAQLLAPTPKACLASVVLAALLPTILYPKEVLSYKGKDAVSAWVTALACCFTDPTQGFGIGLVVHAVLTAYHTRADRRKKALGEPTPVTVVPVQQAKMGEPL